MTSSFDLLDTRKVAAFEKKKKGPAKLDIPKLAPFIFYKLKIFLAHRNSIHK